MKVGDLVLFRGSWGSREKPIERMTGMIMAVWTNGRTRKIQSADVLWDDGTLGNVQTHVLGVLSESR